MRKRGWRFLTRLAAGLPLKFRVLCRQFMLRVVDLEALSVEADVAGYLGQFAGVAIMGSAIHAVIAFAYMSPLNPVQRLGYAWHFEQYLVATMMLVVGLFAVISWDSAFPDRRDIMVLSPLPVAPRMILFAKLAATGAILGIAVLALNIFSGFMWPFVVGMPRQGWPGVFQAFGAYWITMISATLFIYCSVLAVQGFTAIFLPRRLFLWTSAILQLATFGACFGTYFLQGTITSPAGMVAAENQSLLASSPSFWFFALFNQLNGTLPSYLAWLAQRAWISLGIAVTAAGTSLLLCYVHTMRRTVEQPELLPGKRGLHSTMRLGGALKTAVLQFTVRTLTRSRQHRIVLAFYLSIAFAVALGAGRRAIAAGSPRPFSWEFPFVTSLIMLFAVMGFISVFSLPISLTANWVLRTTQVRSTRDYFAATRRTLLLLSVVPAWLLAVPLGLTFRPLSLVAAHLVVLALFGFILAEASLVGFHKIPFTCSLRPGATNFQFTFWKTLAGVALLLVAVTTCETPALYHRERYALLISGLCVIAAVLGVWNQRRAQSAVLYYEDLPDEVITSLRLILPPSQNIGTLSVD